MIVLSTIAAFSFPLPILVRSSYLLKKSVVWM